MKVVIILACTLLGFAAAVFVIILVCNYGYYRYRCDDSMIKMPFSAFKCVYSVIPEQFELDEWCYKNHNKWYKFSYFDAIKYELFRQCEDRRKRKRNNVAGYKEFLENAQNDIEEKQKQIHQETIENLQKIRNEVAKK